MSKHHSYGWIAASLMLLGVLANCIPSRPSPLPLRGTESGKPIYTPVVMAAPGTRLPRAAELVTVQDLINDPKRYADKFIEVHGVNEGTFATPAVVGWVRPPWEWGLAAGPTRAGGASPLIIEVKNTFGDVLRDISNAKGETIRNPYGKWVAVWGWWRLYTGQWGLPQPNALGTPEPSPPHWYLDAVQLQFLESIDVVPPPQYKPMTALAVTNGMIYVGEDSGFTVLDVEDPAHPKRLSHIPLQGSATAIEVIGKRAYATYAPTSTTQGGLQVIDLGDPMHPAVLGGLRLAGGPADIAVGERFAYVANALAGLQIVDVSDPGKMALRSTFDDVGAINRVQAIGNLAYLAGREFFIVDVSAPDQPDLQGTYHLAENGLDVQVDGKRAYVVETAHGLDIVDVGNPAHPTLLGKYTQPSASRVYKAGGLVYLMGFGELHIVDVSNAAAPVARSISHVPEGVAIQVRNNIAYVATYRSGLRILDVSDPGNPKLLATYGIPQ